MKYLQPTIPQRRQQPPPFLLLQCKIIQTSYPLMILHQIISNSSSSHHHHNVCNPIHMLHCDLLLLHYPTIHQTALLHHPIRFHPTHPLPSSRPYSSRSEKIGPCTNNTTVRSLLSHVRLQPLKMTRNSTLSRHQVRHQRRRENLRRRRSMNSYWLVNS